MRDWPTLPQGIKQGVCGIWEGRVYVGLGSAGSAIYRLDLDDPRAGWQACAPFPGPAREGAAFAMDAGRLVVMGGAGKPAADAPSPVVLTDIHLYDTQTDRWTKAAGTTPVGLLGATAWGLGGGRILCAGGYNKPLFDTFVRALAEIDPVADPERHQAHVAGYMGMRPEDYRWNDRLWLYDIAADAWRDMGAKPGLPTTGAALLADGLDALLVNGEVKPGLRSPDVIALHFAEGAVTAEHAAPLAAAPEGLAGAFGGYAQGVTLVAGGVNFPGARANADAGRWYAHQGLSKIWHDAIYALQDGTWQPAGHLPEGLAYGASLSLPEGLVILGGERADLSASDRIHLLRWDATQARVVVKGAD